MKILANDGISAAGKELLEKAGFFVETNNVEQSQLIDAINTQGYEVVLVRSATTVRKEVFDACPGLKMVGRGGVGMDNIDVEYGRSKGVNVFNTPGSSSRSVAELVFAHMFNAVRFVYDSNRLMPVEGATNFKALKKKYGKGSELRGKKLGIIGFGRIGQEVAKYALGCGMEVLPHNNTDIPAALELSIGGTHVQVPVSNYSFEQVLAESDFISIHVPKQPNGAAVIGAAEFAKMKKGVVVVNTARGGVINEEALLEALNNGIVSHACLDVFENEPTPNTAILTHEKISLTPHIGAATNEAQDRIGEEIAEIVKAHYNL